MRSQHRIEREITAEDEAIFAELRQRALEALEEPQMPLGSPDNSSPATDVTQDLSTASRELYRLMVAQKDKPRTLVQAKILGRAIARAKNLAVSPEQLDHVATYYNEHHAQ